MKTTHRSDGPNAPARPVERLFPFVLRSRNLIVGRDQLRRSKSKLHFLLLTIDISENSRAEFLADFAHYPIVQHYTSAELEKHFELKGAKAVGFAKSGLAQSLYAELKQHRINQPMVSSRRSQEAQQGAIVSPGVRPVPQPQHRGEGKASKLF